MFISGPVACRDTLLPRDSPLSEHLERVLRAAALERWDAPEDAERLDRACCLGGAQVLGGPAEAFEDPGLASDSEH